MYACPRPRHLILALSTCAWLAACSEPARETGSTVTAAEESRMTTEDNPFFSPSTLDLQYPPFDRIRDEHFLPAFERGMAEQQAEIAEITRQTAEPTFANTIVPLELSGQLLNRVSTVFFALGSAHTNEAIQALETEIMPRLTEHNDSLSLNPELFARVRTVYEARDRLGLDPESLRLVEETYKGFVRSGALLDEASQERLRAINTELASLETRFDQNVLAERNDSAVVVTSREELAGLSEAEIRSLADEAEARGLSGSYVLPLLNTSGQPLLPSLDNRALRERVLKASLARGTRGNEWDNRDILSRTARLRAERANLLGYPNHAAYVLERQTAQTVAAVNERLADLTPRAIANAEREAAELQAMITAAGEDFELAAWDWAYYAEKVRAEKYSFDENALRPYFEFDNVLQKGVFFAAGQIYGIRFVERHDLPKYHEDIRVFEVFEEDGSTLALFIMDPYARASKRGGAWMNSYVSQSALLETQPIVANHLNIPKPPAGEATLLSFDEVVTMFHEFGHALHGMFSNVNYPGFSGTRVPRDFVEYPSQVNEMWATWPEVLRNYAVHYQSGEAMPEELLERVLAAQQFGQGFATSEYLMASLTDMALHVLTPDEVPTADELLEFEAQTLQAAGALMDTLPPRYRLPYFSHIMGGYSAGYYSYIWSEVLDADTVEWFRENGGMTRANGQHFRNTLLSRGGSEEALELFRKFRGRDASVEPLLRRRGLD